MATRSSPPMPSSLPSLLNTWKLTLGLSKRGQNGFEGTSPPKLPEGLSPLPSLPTLPKLLEFPLSLSALEPTEQSPPTSTGLFLSLLRDPAVLYRDYLDHPEKYDEQTAQLLMELISRTKTLETLTPEDMELLNKATMNFAQPTRPLPKKQSNERYSASVQQTSSESKEEEDEVEWHGPNMRLPPMEIPVDIPTVPTKWWDKPTGGGLR